MGAPVAGAKQVVDRCKSRSFRWATAQGLPDPRLSLSALKVQAQIAEKFCGNWGVQPGMRKSEGGFYNYMLIKQYKYLSLTETLLCKVYYPEIIQNSVTSDTNICILQVSSKVHKVLKCFLNETKMKTS